jgi:hypothetical protein
MTDMRLRGPGDLFGIRQSGQFQFQLGDIYQDAGILQEAQCCATELYSDYIDGGKPSEENQRFWRHYEDNIAADVDWVMRVCSSGYKVLCVDDYFTYFREGGLSSEKRYESLIEQYHAAIQCIQKYHKEYLREKIDDYYNLVLPCVEKEELIKNAFEEHLDEIKELFDEGEYYIWGTGAMAKNCLGIFEKLNIPVAGFIDSYKKQERFENYQVISPDEIDINGYICISSVKYEKEIIDVIKSIGIDESRYFTYAYLMEQIERKGCLEIEEDIILHG